MRIKNIFAIIFLLSAFGAANQLQPVNHEFVFTETREARTVTESRVLFWTTRTENAETAKLAASFRLVDLPYLDDRPLIRDIVYGGRSPADYAKARFAEFATAVSASVSTGLADYSYDEQTEISFAGARFVGLKQTVYAFTGGAHGSTSRNIFVLDLEAGRRLTLSDVLASSAGLAARLEFLLRQKYEMKPEDSFFREVWPPDNFDFTPDGLEFSWGQYAIVPYALGMPAVILPYAELQSLLSARGLEISRAAAPPSQQK
jgi:hypothetical protein